MLTAPPRDADVPLPIPDSFTRPSDTDSPVLTWTVHLLRGRTAFLPRISVCISIVLLSGLLLFHSILLALLPTAALLLSLSEFLLPVRYTLTRQGAQSRQGLMTLEIAWPAVKHAYWAADGIKLSPLSKPNSRLEPLRGVFLRFGDNEPEVIAAVRSLREEATPHA